MERRTLGALNKFIYHLEKNYEGNFTIVPSQAGGRVAIVTCNRFAVAITICQGYRDKWCIKLEEIIVHEEYRKQGVASEVLENLKQMANIEKVKVGLWVRKDRKDLLKFYLKRGFIVKEIIDDIWLEYN